MLRPFTASSGLILLALASTATAQVTTGSNGFYDVAVDVNGDYTSRTGTFHPVPRSNIFYGGTLLSPATTWNSVRSYRSNTEWVLVNTPAIGGPQASTGFTCDSIDRADAPTVTPLLDAGGAPTGVATTWDIANGTDDLAVTQEVQAEGSTYETSVVRVTVCVRNRGTVDAEIGIRFQWDWQIAGQDGAYIGMRPPSPPLEPLLDTEQDFPDPAFASYDVSDVQSPSVTPPTYTIGGTVNEPMLSRGPTHPELVQYVAWPGVVNRCFDYATGAQVVGNTDSGVVYYWGATRATAIVIPPGGEWCATQYVFVFEDVPPPLCDLTALLVGMPSCDAPVTLDASASFGPDCAGPLEFRFTDPTGTVAEDWSADPSTVADVPGSWTVEVRCSTNPSCIARATNDVRIDRIPVLDATAVADSDCGLGVQIDWTATFLGSTGGGAVNVHRSEIDCADALARPPIASCLAATSFTDTATVAGTAYYYVVEAEDAGSSSPCSPVGTCNDGAATRSCLGPITATTSGPVPAGPCWTLRVAHSADDVTLDWATSRALVGGEHFHVLKVPLDPRNPLARVNAEGDTSLSHAENDTSAWLQFFDVRIASACEVESADDEPPWSGGALPTCP